MITILPEWVKKFFHYTEFKEWNCIYFGRWKQFVIVFGNEPAHGKIRMREVTIRYIGKIILYHYKARYV